MRVAFLADIHGNLPALEAVMDDLRLQAPDAVYLVGDQVNRCPWSTEVLDLIAVKGWLGIRGNHELVLRRLARPHEPFLFDDKARFPDLWWTLDSFDERHLQMLDDWPDELDVDLGAGPPLRLVHGVPGNAYRGFFADTADEDAAALLAGVRAPVVVCGHTHTPLRRSVGRWQVLNGGSVGQPYNGDTRAQYLMLTKTMDGWRPSYRRIDYPLQTVRDAFHVPDMVETYGPLIRIHERSLATAQPWVSDFHYWLTHVRPDLQQQLGEALDEYERSHGPGRWAFVERQ